VRILTVVRSPGRTWLVAILSVPFVILGLDLLLLPRLFPQYVRRLDLLADEMGLSRITATGPEEPWGLIFLLAGSGMLFWALKDLLFPLEMLGVDDHGVSFGSLLGPGGGEFHVPHSEITEVAPAVLVEGSDRSPAVAIRFTDPSRLPSNPWGAVWVDHTLFIRTSGWTATPRQITSVLTDDTPAETGGYLVELEAEPVRVTEVEEDPTDAGDPQQAYVTRSRAWIGGVLLLAALLFAAFLWIAGTETKAYYLLPVALGAAGGVLFINGYRDYLEAQ
jgi:hypothetical protein